MESGDGLVLDWLLKAVGGSRCNFYICFGYVLPVMSLYCAELLLFAMDDSY